MTNPNNPSPAALRWLALLVEEGKLPENVVITGITSEMSFLVLPRGDLIFESDVVDILNNIDPGFGYDRVTESNTFTQSYAQWVRPKKIDGTEISIAAKLEDYSE